MLGSMLIVLDGREYSTAALELGIRWAKRFDALPVGLGIINEPVIRRPEPVPIGGGYYKQDRDQSLLADATIRNDAIVSNFRRSCEEVGLQYGTAMEVGCPSSEIARQSRSYDLVVIGQETYFQIETQDSCDNTLWELLQQTSRPLVTVPQALDSTDTNRVLVAYNGSPEANRAIQAFESLGLADSAELHVLSVEKDCARAGELAEEAATFLKLHDVTAIVHFRTQAGAPAKAILEHAEQLQVDLIVMGACGRPRWRELLFGSTTWQVVEESSVPLFLCH